MNQQEINSYLQLQTSIIDAKEDVASFKLSIKVAQDELRLLNIAIQKTELELNLETYINEKDALQQQLSDLNSELAMLEDQKVNSEAQLADLKSVASQISADISLIKTKISDNNSEIVSLQQQEPSRARDEVIADLKSEIVVLEENLSILNEALDKNGLDQTALQNLINTINASINQKSNEISVVDSDLTILISEFEGSQQILDGIYSNRTVKESEITGLTEHLNYREEELRVDLESFSLISDPRTLTEAINDDSPFLLLPVRLETRFMTIKHVKKVDSLSEYPVQETTSEIPQIQPNNPATVQDKKELWVRIFPDDIAIDTHEKQLSEDEFEAGKIYWFAIWGLDPMDSETENTKLGAWRTLVASYGPERAAWIVGESKPTNSTVSPLPAAPVFPTLILKLDAWAQQPASKVMPDRFVVRLYSASGTYREVLGSLVPDPLPLGFDPSSTDLDDQFDQVDKVVSFPADVKWLSDFDEAEQVGMGIRIPLIGTEPTQGFEKILVLGLKLAADKTTSKNLLEELIDNHHYTSGGFSLVTQGTPTNNTEDATAGFENHEIGNEETFATELGDPLFQSTTERINKTDGQWFSEMLGISESTVQHVRNADKFDQQEEMAMNSALWPATMGYYLKQMLSPLVFSKAHNDIREFYADHIMARGRIPAFRVQNQPYGVLLSSAFSKWKYPTVPTYTSDYTLKKMHEDILSPLQVEFESLINEVIHSESTGDTQENFLKMLGLHASSVEFHQRFGSGQHFSWNVLQYFRNAPTSGSGDEILEMDASIPEALRAIYSTSVGFNMPISPRILRMLFVEKERLLNGPVIDLDPKFPYSETRGIQPFPETTTNYIEWLLMSDFGRIRTENFNNIPDVLSGQKPPQALLYLLLRHGYLLEHINAAMQILNNQNITYPEAEVEYELQKDINDELISVEESSVLSDLVTAESTLNYELGLEDRIQQMEKNGSITPSNRETVKEQIRQQEAAELEFTIQQEFETRRQNFSVEQKKWNYLDIRLTDVTGNKTMLEHILSTLSLTDPFTGYLAKVKQSLEILKDMPTARLERCMAESLDICNYRLDAWMTGLVNKRAEEQMETARQNGTEGSFLGAYGILENLKPNVDFPGIYVEELATNAANESELYIYMGADSSTMLELDDEINAVVSPARINQQNLGFIHGPSMNHAITAAILRAGYAGHEGTASPNNAMAINLRSDRVRQALFYIEGIRNGQDLAALLGYKFERALHDLDQGLDQYILDIRREHPLVANGLVPNDPSEGSIDAFEARNVVDGLKLIEVYRENPTGWHTPTGITDATALSLINAQILEITNHMDAIGDLMMAEGMFQVATGNLERAGAVIKALGEGNMIPEPQIIKTPRLDKVFMQRHAVLFDTATANDAEWSNDATPRSFSEPALNSWIASVLPSPTNIIIKYEYTTYDVGGNAVITEAQMTLDELNLQPIDFIAMITDQGGAEDGTELSAMINYLVIHTISNTEAPVSIKFIDRTGLTSNQVTIFELLPLARSIQEIIGQGRCAKPQDFLIEGDVYAVTEAATPTQGIDLTNMEARLTEVFGPSASGPDGLVDVKLSLSLAKTAADGIVDIVGNESLLDTLRDSLIAAFYFATQGAIPSVAYEYSLNSRDLLSAQAARILSQLDGLEAAGTVAFTELGTLTETEDRLEKLQEIAQILFGRSFKVFPEFNFFNTADLNLSLGNVNLLNEGGEFALEEWLHGISKVRPKMSNYHLKSMVQGSLLDVEPNLNVIQLPIGSNVTDRWLGATLPAGYPIPDQAISIVMETPAGFTPANLQSGIILDEWSESISEPNAITGLAMNYDQPNSEAPNALIMAITPEITGNWEWSDLMDVLNDTLKLAKQRAVEPDIINANSVLGHALPTIMASVEASDSAPGMDFSRNIIEANSGQVGPIDLQQYVTFASE